MWGVVSTVLGEKGMRIILVESTTAAQAATARKLGSIDRIDRDTLDLSIGLADEESVFGRLDACDVLIVGASVGKRSLAIAKRAKDESPHLEIIILVPAVEYAAGAFRSALWASKRSSETPARYGRVVLSPWCRLKVAWEPLRHARLSPVFVARTVSQLSCGT
jgi:hypothetical protein